MTDLQTAQVLAKDSLIFSQMDSLTTVPNWYLRCALWLSWDWHWTFFSEHILTLVTRVPKKNPICKARWRHFKVTSYSHQAPPVKRLLTCPIKVTTVGKARSNRGEGSIGLLTGDCNRTTREIGSRFLFVLVSYKHVQPCVNKRDFVASAR